MIEGYINTQGEPIIILLLSGFTGIEIEVNSVLDTGFSEYLTLPGVLIESLELPWFEITQVQLGDGSKQVVDVYRARALWNGEWRRILIQSAETDSLAGLKLLDGHHLEVDFVDGGKLTIERIE